MEEDESLKMEPVDTSSMVEESEEKDEPKDDEEKTVDD
jgi:hypothetical protein